MGPIEPPSSAVGRIATSCRAQSVRPEVLQRVVDLLALHCWVAHCHRIFDSICLGTAHCYRESRTGSQEAPPTCYCHRFWEISLWFRAAEHNRTAHQLITHAHHETCRTTSAGTRIRTYSSSSLGARSKQSDSTRCILGGADGSASKSVGAS